MYSILHVLYGALCTWYLVPYAAYGNIWFPVHMLPSVYMDACVIGALCTVYMVPCVPSVLGSLCNWYTLCMLYHVHMVPCLHGAFSYVHGTLFTWFLM